LFVKTYVKLSLFCITPSFQGTFYRVQRSINERAFSFLSCSSNKNSLPCNLGDAGHDRAISSGSILIQLAAYFSVSCNIYIRLQIGSAERNPHTAWGFTTAIAETGVEVSLTQNLADLDERLPVQIELVEERLVLQGQIMHLDTKGEFPIAKVRFEPLNLAQQRQLIRLLYCRPGQWKSRCSPGELRSLWLLVNILLRPRFLDRTTETRSISVSHD
jgi:hypothetical protein